MNKQNMNNVLMLVLLVAPLAVSAAWSVGSIEIASANGLQVYPMNGNVVTVKDVLKDGKKPSGQFYAVFLPWAGLRQRE